jgi:phage FluMu protein Com
VHTTLATVRLAEARDGDLRCDCGKLLARVLRAVLELKCPRCKRVVLVVGDQRFEPRGTPPCSCCPASPEEHNAP